MEITNFKHGFLLSFFIPGIARVACPELKTAQAAKKGEQTNRKKTAKYLISTSLEPLCWRKHRSLDLERKHLRSLAPEQQEGAGIWEAVPDY